MAGFYEYCHPWNMSSFEDLERKTRLHCLQKLAMKSHNIMSTSYLFLFESVSSNNFWNYDIFKKDTKQNWYYFAIFPLPSSSDELNYNIQTPHLLPKCLLLTLRCLMWGTRSRTLQKKPYQLLQFEQRILHKMPFSNTNAGIQGKHLQQKNVNAFISSFLWFFQSSLISLRKAHNFWMIALKQKKKRVFFLIFLINRKYLSLQCFLFGHRAHKSFYSHFSLKLREPSICLEVKMRKKNKKLKNSRIFGEFLCM